MSTDLTDRIHAAKSLAIFTGAGMSAESGVPTFREAQTGLWAQFSPEELATPQAFAANPERVLDWYRWRLSTATSVRPNAGHFAIARWQSAHPETVVLTQNVDGLHQRATREIGADTGEVVELHGRISHLRCERCGAYSTWPVPDPGGVLVHECGGKLRPDIVWFGEPMPPAAWARAMQVMGLADVVLVVGTSGLVQPAATLPLVARSRGAFVVEVNPERTAVTDCCDMRVAGPAATRLPELLAG